MSTGAEITAMGGVDVVHEDSMEYEYPEQDPVDASDMENDYDDPVLKEFDVFFAPSSHLHLLQFPNRTAAFPYPPTASSYKPLSHKFKMDYALSGVRDHYSTDQARDLTLGLEEDPMNPKGLQEISYVSSVIPFTASYMMGCIKENGLYLVPLHQIHQLRPSLDYLDSMDEKTKSANQKAAFEEAMETEGMDMEEEAKVVHLTVRSAEEKEAAEKMEHVELLKQQEQEKWMSLNLHLPDDPMSLTKVTEAFAISQTDLPTSSTALEYLDMISPKMIDETKTGKVKAKQGLTVHDMEKLTLKEKILSILLNAQILTFDVLREMLDLDTPDSSILEALEDVAFCIRGLWILKSHYIYKDRVLDARNYLLFLFQRVSLVKRSIFNEVARLPLELSKTLMEEIACLEPESRSWVLKVPEDKDFIRTYPEIVARQKKVLEAEGQAAKEDLAKGSSAAQVTKAKPKAPSTSKSVKAAPVEEEKSAAMEISEDLPETMEDQLEQVLTQTLEKYHVCSLPFLNIFVSQRRNNSGIKGNLITKDIPKETIQKVLEKICFTLRSVYVLKAFGAPELTQARAKVVDSFRRKKNVKLADVRKKLKGTVEYDPTDEELQEIIKTIAHRESDFSWTFKESPKNP